MLFLGIDVGSSSVKLSILDGSSGKTISTCQHPETELTIASPAPGFAEQDPQVWWSCVKHGLAKLRTKADLTAIKAIGIAYQMHGLVVVDANSKVLRPAIIWCDSRAVGYGQSALKDLGADYCYGQLLNSPGNFTAAKLRWIQQNEADIYAKIHRIMLPGDYIAMQFSGEINTTASGLSEGTLWDFTNQSCANTLLTHWDINPSLIPSLVPSLGLQATVSAEIASELGLTAGTPITYRAGDQPNNAFSLNVLEPGEVAATAGTSGVIYAVTDQPAADVNGRVNTFLHVSHQNNNPRNGVLACVNGTGRAYSWLRQILSTGSNASSYPALNALADTTPIGAEGLCVLPFGNGAERLLQNINLGAHFSHIDHNRHHLGHMVRATQEGIAFALNKGFDVLKSIGVSCNTIKAGNSNLFLSPLFSEAFAHITGATIELYNTDGAEGAARAAAIGAGFYRNAQEAFTLLSVLTTITPTLEKAEQYQAAYQQWNNTLNQQIHYFSKSTSGH